MKRFAAHHFLGSSNRTTVNADTLAELQSFVVATKSALAVMGGTVNVADMRSKSSAPWIWSMSENGVTTTDGKYGKMAAELFGR